MDIFYLGVHRPKWCEASAIPLMISRNTLARMKNIPVSSCDLFLDSGGFTEVSLYGRWRCDARSFACEMRMYSDVLGREHVKHISPQDWMCEPFVLNKTGLSVEDHQRLTVDNYIELRSIAPDLPFVPVLQGWDIADYDAHVEMYARAGIDLQDYDLVGVGSVCRRQKMQSAAAIIGMLSSYGLSLHGFGFKVTGLGYASAGLASADSMAWSYGARYNPPLPGCAHRNCANCWKYAEQWYYTKIEPYLHGVRSMQHAMPW